MSSPTLSHAVVLNHRGDNDSPDDPNLATLQEVLDLMVPSATASSVTSQVVSRAASGALDSIPVSTADSKGVSSGLRASIADSKALSSSANTSVADSKALSVSVNTSVADSKATSVGLFGAAPSLSLSTQDSKILSVVTDIGPVPTNGRTVTTHSAFFTNNLVYNVADYGAVSGASSATIKTAIQAALTAAKAAGGGMVYIPPGSYDIGSMSGAASVFSLTSATDIRISGYGVRIILSTSDNSQTKLFSFLNCERIHCEGLRMRDDGADTSIEWRGAIMFYLRVTDSSTYRNFSFVRCGSEKGVSFFTSTSYDGVASTPSASGFIKEITIDGCFATNTYYGINCQDAGSGVRIRGFRCINVKRGYFPYGVEDHVFDITMSQDSGTGNNCILFKHYYYNLRNIKGRLNVLGAYTADSCVEFQQQPTGGGAAYVDDIEVDLHIDTNGAKTFTNGAVYFDSFTAAGVEELTSTTNRWDRIKLSGSFGNVTADPKIKFGSTGLLKQTTEGRLYLDPSIYQSMDAARPDYKGFVVRVAHDREFRTYTGDLTALTMAIPCAGFDGEAFGLVVRYYATDHSSLTQNFTLREDHILAYNQSGGAVVVISANNSYARAAGTGLTPTYTGSGENINVTFAGAPYNAVGSFIKLEVQYAQGPRLAV